MTVCRHCKRGSVNRPRGLCWPCYYTPGVKDLYVTDSPYASRGVGHFSGPAPVPDEPTDAVPGTPEKIAVMARRAEEGRQVFHPADARYAGDPRPHAFRAGLTLPPERNPPPTDRTSYKSHPVFFRD